MRSYAQREKCDQNFAFIKNATFLPGHVCHVGLGGVLDGVAFPVQFNALPRERKAEVTEFRLISFHHGLTMWPPWPRGRQ